MKYFGSIMDFTHERNEDLMRVFREFFDKSDFIIISDLFQRVADSPSKRFWVSENRAAVVISAMLAKKRLPKMNPNKQEMFNEIFRRFNILREQRPDISFRELIAEVISQPAPKFYLAPRTVCEYFYRIKNGWYRNKQLDN